MKVLYFSSFENATEQKYQLAIESVVPLEKIEVIKTVKDLSHRLRQPIQNIAAVVLLARNSEEFFDLFTIRDLLCGLRLLLILPNPEAETRPDELSLYPSYVGYMDQDVSEVSAVLSKIVNRNKWSKQQ